MNRFTQYLKRRFQLSARYASMHFLITLTVAILIGCLVFFVWYPEPYRQMAGGLELYQLIMVVDIICGPLLTFILISPKKSRKAILIDISAITLIQLSALTYGLYNVTLARPVAVVFEYNRFSLVNYLSVEQASLDKISSNIPFYGVSIVALKQISDDEKNEVLSHFLKTGVDMGMRPEFWEDYEQEKSQAWEAAIPLSSLPQLTLSDQDKLSIAIDKTGINLENLRYLPIITPLSDNWITLLNENGDIVGYANINGW